MSRWRPFTFSHKLGLAPGRYSLRARTEQGQAGELAFDVEAADAAAQTIRLPLR